MGFQTELLPAAEGRVTLSCDALFAEVREPELVKKSR